MSSDSSTSTSSLYSSSSRITSMYSNMDTDAIVKKLCSRQQAKIDKEYQEKTTYTWKQEALTEISDAVEDFSNAYCSVLGSSSMLKNSTYIAYNVTTSDTSGAVSVSADSSAYANSVAVSVQQVAKNSSLTGKSGISKNGELSEYNTAKLSDLEFKTPLTAGPDGNISFSINGKTFSFTPDATLQSMINTVNSDADAGVTMTYSRLTDSFSLSADAGGADSSIAIKNISGNAFGDGGAFGIAEGTTKNGQNAKVTINNVPVEKNNNGFTIDGLTYEIKNTTGTAITFNVARDYTTTTDAVQGFTDALNTLIDKINKYTTAKDNSKDYPPLTEAQRDDMTDDQIKKWEDKAKIGILRYDSGLESLVSGLKNAFFSSAGGTGKSGASVGISTGSYFDKDAGLLQVNTDTLKDALASDPDTVMQIFTGGSSTVSSDQKGVVYKVKEAVNSYLDHSDETLDSIDDTLKKITSTMKDMKKDLSDLADKYYRKFSKMETALSKLNSTSSMVSSMFGGSSGSNS